VPILRWHGFDVRNVAGKQQATALRMPRGDPNGEIGIVQVADNAAAEKPVPPNTVTLRRHDVITRPS
jgi:hypothetical protein